MPYALNVSVNVVGGDETSPVSMVHIMKSGEISSTTGTINIRYMARLLVKEFNRFRICFPNTQV